MLKGSHWEVLRVLWTVIKHEPQPCNQIARNMSVRYFITKILQTTKIPHHACSNYNKFHLTIWEVLWNLFLTSKSDDWPSNRQPVLHKNTLLINIYIYKNTLFDINPLDFPNCLLNCYIFDKHISYLISWSRTNRFWKSDSNNLQILTASTSR
jgi:hypothetical protein